MSGIQNKASIIITDVKKIFGLGTVWGNPIIKYQGEKHKEKSATDKHSRWKIRVQWLKVGNNTQVLIIVTPCQSTYQRCFKDCPKIRISVPEENWRFEPKPSSQGGTVVV